MGAKSVRESRGRLHRTWRGDGWLVRAKADEERPCFVGLTFGGFFTRTVRLLAVDPVVEFTDMVDIGREPGIGREPNAVDFLSLAVGLGAVGSLDFDLPKPKSLLRNPGSLVFRYENNGLGIARAEIKALT